MRPLVIVVTFLLMMSACEILPSQFPGDNPSESVKTTDDLRISLDITASDIDELHDIRADFGLENITDDTLSYTFRSGCQSEFTISRNGTEIADSRDGRGCTAAITHLVLAPGESKTYDISTESMRNRGLEAGSYQMTAFLLGDKGVEISTTFSVQ